MHVIITNPIYYLIFKMGDPSSIGKTWVWQVNIYRSEEQNQFVFENHHRILFMWRIVLFRVLNKIYSIHIIIIELNKQNVLPVLKPSQTNWKTRLKIKYKGTCHLFLSKTEYLNTSYSLFLYDIFLLLATTSQWK